MHDSPLLRTSARSLALVPALAVLASPSSADEPEFDNLGDLKGQSVEVVFQE